MWQALKNIYHLLQAIVANILYGFPSRGLTIIGVTGTDGKTTTASLIYHILNNAGYKAALISSVGAIIGGKASDIGFHVTTPGRFDIQKYLKKAKKAGVKYVVLEVTSHALDQHRVFGVHFAIGVITNINREHLDYHKTYEKYVHAKAKLLKNSKIAIVNKDDQSYKRIKSIKGMKSIKSYKKVITYGFKKDSDINPHIFPFKTKLIGKFNEYNCLAAIAVLRQLNIPDEEIKKGVASFKPPIGRQEIVYDKDFTVINDFAHTPQSFASVLPEIKKMTSNRLIHVFGSAGLRDKYKRPEMGRISWENADIIILTAEDPRIEDVEIICQEIMSGIKNSPTVTSKLEILDYKHPPAGGQNTNIQKEKKYLFIIPDRKEAINFAISLARKGDTVLLTGKGHEKSINYGKGEEPWDETKVALEALRNKK